MSNIFGEQKHFFNANIFYILNKLTLNNNDLKLQTFLKQEQNFKILKILRKLEHKLKILTLIKSFSL